MVCKEDITKEYITFLKELKQDNHLIYNFSKLKDYNQREEFLKTFYNEDLLNILQDEEFLKLFYLDAQAKFIQHKLSFNSLDDCKTLVYCYNTNSRDFNFLLKEEELKKGLLEEGYKEVNPLEIETLKELHNLKVLCVFDRDKISFMGSFTAKEKHKGTLIYMEENNSICFLPFRHSKTGQILRNKFYYKLR